MALQTDLIDDLTTELTIADDDFNAALLEVKVSNAIKEVIRTRNYPDTYTTAMIDKDLEKYYSNLRDIVLYDYSHVGAYGEIQRNEDGINRQYVDRDKLFKGILPLSRL